MGSAKNAELMSNGLMKIVNAKIVTTELKESVQCVVLMLISMDKLVHAHVAILVMDLTAKSHRVHQIQ